MTGLCRFTIRRAEGVYFVLGPFGTFGPYQSRAVAAMVAFNLKAMLHARTEIEREIERALIDKGQQAMREHFDRLLKEMAGAVGRLAADPGEEALYVEDDGPTPAPPMSRRNARRP